MRRWPLVLSAVAPWSTVPVKVSGHGFAGSHGALVVGLAMLLLSVQVLLLGTGGQDPLATLLNGPAARAAWATAAPFDGRRVAAPAARSPRVHIAAGDPLAADHRSGSGTTPDAVAANPIGPMLPEHDGRRRPSGAFGDLVTALERGTCAESAHLATIETRRDDPRLELLRTALWSRERRPTGVRTDALVWPRGHK